MDEDYERVARIAARFLRERRARASSPEERLASYWIGADEAGPEWTSLRDAGFYRIGDPLRVSGSPSGLYEATRPTPLVAARLPGCGGRVWFKLEWFNPYSLSMKDRTVYELLRRVPGGTVWEASSGNTGVALAAMASAGGRRAVVLLPRHAARTQALLAGLLGARVLVTRAGSTVEIEGPGEGVRLGQLDSIYNPVAHMRWTGREIIVQLESLGARPAGLVVPSGTGGTVSGSGFMLQNYYGGVRVFRVVPREGEVVEGTRRSRPPWLGVLGVSTVDVEVSRREALEGMLLLARSTGLAPGVSGGAAVSAALRVCGEVEGDLVVILPDHASKYPEAMEEALALAGEV